MCLKLSIYCVVTALAIASLSLFISEGFLEIFWQS